MLAFSSVRTDKPVNAFQRAYSADHTNLFYLEAHFLHYDKAWEPLGIFNSGKSNSSES